MLLPAVRIPCRVRGALGVMVNLDDEAGIPPFRNQSFLRKLVAYGERQGIDLFVFTPGQIDWLRQTVRGYTYSGTERAWTMQVRPLPSVVYDRLFHTDKRQLRENRPLVARLKNQAGVIFMGCGLSGKWEVQQWLAKEPAVAPYLPASRLYDGPETMLDWLRRDRALFVKPVAGSQGKGVVRLELQPPFAQGRTRDNAPIRLRFANERALADWVARFVGSRKHMLQQALDLRTKAGESFDIRSLVQKDGKGRWQWTGMAARIGAPGSVTANLHAGGRAEDASTFLEREFGTFEADRIAETIERLSLAIPPLLERRQGRLCELGLDFGVDALGRVWFIEANSKPGRSAFRAITRGRADVRSVARPIEYARFLIEMESLRSLNP